MFVTTPIENLFVDRAQVTINDIKIGYHLIGMLIYVNMLNQKTTYTEISYHKSFKQYWCINSM